MTIAAISCVLFIRKALLHERDFLCAGMFSTFQDCFGKRKNFLDTATGKSFAGGVGQS